MRLIISLMAAFAVGVLLVLAGCSPDRVAGGTSTSENGRVAGKIRTADGVAAARTQILLVPVAFDPVADTVALRSDTTDPTGFYALDNIAPGEYILQCVHLDERTRALSCDVEVNNDSVVKADLTLEKSGSIKIALPDSTSGASGYVYIPGTTISVPVGADATFALLDSVPTGTIPSVVYVSTAAVRRLVLQSAVGVKPGATATIFTTGWRYSRQIRLNTSASGADVKQTLYRFPVCIKLTRHFFPFDQARPDGSDLLFTKDNGTVLPYEIERWDAAGKVAEIWLAVDTLPENDSAFQLTMYWGNSRKNTATVNSAVFDTAAGFAGVWHLDESGDTLFDATTNRYNGSRHGSVASTAGVIGEAQRFDTSVAYCEVGNVLNPGNGNFTISAWVRRSATGLQAILSKSNGGSPSSAYGWLLTFGENDQLECFIATGGTSWGTTGSFGVYSKAEATVTDTVTWHYIVAVIDRSANAASRMYLDGEDVTYQPGGEIGAVGSLVNTVPLRIGAEADSDYQWAGLIDECVFSSTVRSAAWVRLCYSNQGPDDRLVEFR